MYLRTDRAGNAKKNKRKRGSVGNRIRNADPTFNFAPPQYTAAFHVARKNGACTLSRIGGNQANTLFREKMTRYVLFRLKYSTRLTQKV